MKRLYQSVFVLFFIPVFNFSYIHPVPGVKLYVSHFENVLGTSFELKVSAASENVADAAETVALAEIDRLASILSAYDSSSEFSRWNKSGGQAVTVSDELFTVLALFDHWKISTGGALDPSAEAISRLWKKAEKNNTLPGSQEIKNAVELANEQHWLLNNSNHTAARKSNVPLMMNSFVKSYIIKKATEKVIAIPGIQGVMVNIGGDIVVAGDMNENIRISDPLNDAENDVPLTSIRVQNKAVATSGNYRRGYAIGGQWYSHIIDPRTGIPANEIISATVVSPVATDAGALATAFNILSIEESKKLASSIPGTEYLIISRKGEKFVSEHWHQLEIISDVPGSVKPQAQGDYELLINLELAQFEGRFRRPFVAVWITDSEKKTVRNLALWFNKPRWLPDLKEWYRTNYQDINRSGKTVESISSATRPPGKYSIKWDLTDDKGNPVPTGRYTVYIEAAREHGTYQLMKKEIDCKKKELSVTIPGNTEISSASLEYRKTGKNP